LFLIIYFFANAFENVNNAHHREQRAKKALSPETQPAFSWLTIYTLLEKTMTQDQKNERDSIELLDDEFKLNPASSTLSEEIKVVLNKEVENETKTLILQFDDAEKISQLEKGKILIQLSEIAKKENIYFKDLIKAIAINTSLSEITDQHRARLMRLCFFNESRPMNGISVTVGYEISAQKNEEIALKLYSAAVGKNLSVKEIQDLANQLRTTSTKVQRPRQNKVIALTPKALTLMDTVQKIAQDKQEMFEVIANCYEKLREELKLEKTNQAYSTL
jgi:hypothetical protein